MPRTETDFGLWLVCFLAVGVVVCLPAAIDLARGQGSAVEVAVTVGVSLFLGWVIQGAIVGARRRWPSKRPEQAEDYDDEGRK